MRRLILLLLVPALLCAAASCLAEIDPILLNEPNDSVFGCKDDIFIELMEPATISKTAGGRYTGDYYLYFKAEILFLPDTEWNGLDKASFALQHTDAEGNKEIFPLNYAISALMNLRNGWPTLSQPFYFTSLTLMYLVFDVNTTAQDGWVLLFRPTERGAEDPYCEMDIPLRIRR